MSNSRVAWSAIGRPAGVRKRDTMSEPVNRHDYNLNPVEAKLPLRFNGMEPAAFIKCAYGLGEKLDGPGRYDRKDPVQQELRRIRDWITMAEHDALDARKVGE